MRVLYSGYTTTLTMSIPFQAMYPNDHTFNSSYSIDEWRYFASYESLVKVIKGPDIHSGEYPYKSLLLALLTRLALRFPLSWLFIYYMQDIVQWPTFWLVVGREWFQRAWRIPLTSPEHGFKHKEKLYLSAWILLIHWIFWLEKIKLIQTTQQQLATTGATTTTPKIVQYQGMLDALQTIWKDEGMVGFTRGIKPRMVFHSMSAAVSFYLPFSSFHSFHSSSFILHPHSFNILFLARPRAFFAPQRRHFFLFFFLLFFCCYIYWAICIWLVQILWTTYEFLKSVLEPRFH